MHTEDKRLLSNYQVQIGFSIEDVLCTGLPAVGTFKNVFKFRVISNAIYEISTQLLNSYIYIFY